MAFVLVLFTVVVILRDSFVRQRVTSETVRDSDVDIEAATIDKFAGQYGLTKREAEVAMLLSRGYTFPQSAEFLCLSLDTVRSHSKSIYRKLGIHKKQELITAVEQVKCGLRLPQ